MTERYFTPKQVAGRLEIPIKTVLHAIRTGDLEVIRWNRRVFTISEKMLVAWVDSRRRASIGGQLGATSATPTGDTP